MPAPIFINYRRVKTRDKALILRWILEKEFGEGVVFLDDQSISPGAPWKPELEKALEDSKVVISLIHPDWHKDSDDDGSGDRLLPIESDWVRKELSLALSRSCTMVIPLLINDAYKDPQGQDVVRLQPPAKEWLPSEIQSLFDQQAFRLPFNNLTRANLLEFIGYVEKLLPEERRRQQVLPEETEQQGYYIGVLDKEFPLPGDLKEVDPPTDSPYVGIRPFRREDARIFFGRSKEIYELCYKLTNDSHRLLLLDGYSGTGKSSLLQAGLIPRIEAQGWKVLYSRREEDKFKGLPGLLTKAIGSIVHHDGKKLVILDQVEESLTNKILTLPDEIPKLIDDIVNALEDDDHLYVMLGFRAEYTAHIRHELEQHVEKPRFDAKNTLHPLERSGLIEAIRSISEDKSLNGPGKKYHVRFRPSATVHKTIADRLIASKAGSHIAPLLQVNMELFWEKCRQPDQAVVFTSQMISGIIDTNEALLDHYVGKIRENVTEGQVDDQVLFKILHFYVEQKPASSVKTDMEFNDHFRSESFASSIWQACRNLYLLYGQGSGDKAITRLSHDSMAHVIFKRYHDLTVKKQATRAIYFFETLQKDIEEEIYTLQYDKAVETLERMMTLEEHRQEIYPYFFELTFFWNEAGKKDKAHKVLQYWINSGLLVGDQLDQTMALLQNDPDQQTIRAWLLYIEPSRYADMQARYLAPDDIVMVKVEGGEFLMGDEVGDLRNTERPVHKVRLDDYLMANIQVTWWKYWLYAMANDILHELEEPSWGTKGDHPVVNVNWYDAVEYCNWLSRVHGRSPMYAIEKETPDPNNFNDDDRQKWSVTIMKGNTGFRLPTEAEWEYAARGGKLSRGYKYAGGNYMDQVGWYPDNSGRTTHPVGTKIPNELGLSDLSGNVFEWCWDWDKPYPSTSLENPEGALTSNRRVVRGGSWYNVNDDLFRVASRYYYDPLFRLNNFGLRLCRYPT